MPSTLPDVTETAYFPKRIFDTYFLTIELAAVHVRTTWVLVENSVDTTGFSVVFSESSEKSTSKRSTGYRNVFPWLVPMPRLTRGVSNGPFAENTIVVRIFSISYFRRCHANGQSIIVPLNGKSFYPARRQRNRVDSRRFLRGTRRQTVLFSESSPPPRTARNRSGLNCSRRLQSDVGVYGGALEISVKKTSHRRREAKPVGIFPPSFSKDASEGRFLLAVDTIRVNRHLPFRTCRVSDRTGRGPRSRSKIGLFAFCRPVSCSL